MPRFKLATPADYITAPHPSSRTRVHYNQVMRLVRRAHLYTALFMTPWVFLYGVTAFLFNHPDVFPDRPVHAIGERELSGESLGALPKPGNDLTGGALADAPEGDRGGEISSRRFLTELHMEHGYPARLGAQWAWAVTVDLMSVSMVGWGVTGLLMWWQMKNVRRVGAVVLAFSLVAAATIAVGMHGSLASSATTAGEKPAGPREEPAKSRGTRGYPSPKKPDETRPVSGVRIPIPEGRDFPVSNLYGSSTGLKNRRVGSIPTPAHRGQVPQRRQSPASSSV